MLVLHNVKEEPRVKVIQESGGSLLVRTTETPKANREVVVGMVFLV